MTISNRKIKERKIRKQLILDSALEVFKANGIENATMEGIALKAGFGTATLYYYFHSKEEVFAAILLNGWEKLWEELEPVIKEIKSPRKTFVQVLLKTAKTIRNRPGLYEFLFNAPKKISFENEPWKKYQIRIYSIIQSLLKDGIKAQEFPQINSQLLFKAMGGLFMGLVLMGNKKKSISEPDIENLIDQLIFDPSK
tara:strand:- start:480 stop:1070 length:591 start_codon:yes stop_codon:yes gene_type:complete